MTYKNDKSNCLQREISVSLLKTLLDSSDTSFMAIFRFHILYVRQQFLFNISNSPASQICHLALIAHVTYCISADEDCRGGGGGGHGRRCD
ncbi:Hypothetical predicted protein [Octopus vulgaris]|uniref:Uncharacterized protein n=1 Tax=Octopus vulgaris TaxID=6645 RepID=A0AA36EXN6_OCTVU|nr:Hypothetical predicted protein [Octopus vulgaris]